jgi:hypothetical protein
MYDDMYAMTDDYMSNDWTVAQARQPRPPKRPVLTIVLSQRSQMCIRAKLCMKASTEMRDRPQGVTGSNA